MGTTLKRIAFVSRIDGKLRPQEWCLINDSTFGTMVEPTWGFQFYSEKQTGGLGTDDFTNEAQRVDEVLEINENLLPQMLSGGGTQFLHGGRHWPRSGR